MIYLVSRQQTLFESEYYKMLSVEDSLAMINSWGIIQLDTETTGRDAHICNLLCVQFGNDKADAQIVVDTTTIDILLYKGILESKYCILQNAKFDLQFFFKYGIIIRKVYDTMIVEQLLHLGYPSGVISYSLKEIALRRLGIDIDKTVRGEIIWRGLDDKVIVYAAGDVMYLEKIMNSQLIDLKSQGMITAAKLECDFIPSLAYTEWCGILLDESKWKEKMKKDKLLLDESLRLLNKYVEDRHTTNSKFCKINLQGDLFSGFDDTIRCSINWNSPEQTAEYFQHLGFDTKVKDKETGEDKNSVLEKYIKTQKGIADDFQKLYFDYKEHFKVCSTYGQGHLNMINPITGRIHTTFKQLGAASGRLSCGSSQSNTDLAAYKSIPKKECTYANLQQLPADEPTRSAFVAPKGYKFVSADFSAEESRLGADIYQDEAFLDEFINGSGDTHSMFAWAVFRKECEDCGCKSVADVKKLAPKWRKEVKGVEFAYMFGAAAPTISQSANCSVEKAQEYIDALDKAFSGMAVFAKKGSKFVRENGYIIMCKHTGHRMYWWDHNKWLERQKSFTQEFWEDYRNNHKGTGDTIAIMVKKHFQAAAKWDRMARNAPTQGTGACIMKRAMRLLFDWIVDNNYFNKIHICVSVHDEINCDYPEEIEDFPKILTVIMESAASEFCKSLPIPAEASVSDHWVH